jgi:F-type H+-transporting ATPase subunit delta
MRNTKVATRYARALLDLAIEQGKLDSVLGDMQVFSATVKESSEFELLLSNPIVKEHRGIVPMTLTSASTLDANTRDAIIAKVQSSVEGTLEVEEKIDESLIGGFVVRMGDVQIDASVANQLNNLKQRLTR